MKKFKEALKRQCSYFKLSVKHLKRARQQYLVPVLNRVEINTRGNVDPTLVAAIPVNDAISWPKIGDYRLT